MLTSLKKNQFGKDFCSFEICHDGIAFAQISVANSANTELQQTAFHPYSDITHLEFTISEIVQKYNLKNMDCNIILHPKDYRLLLVSKPNVPNTEYRSAIKWLIKDMIDYPLEDLTIDIFAPSGLNENTAKKLYVIAAQTSFVKGIYNIALRAQLKPIAIDIREFAIRNLLVKIISQNESAIFVHADQTNSLLLIINKNMIYFVRQILVGLNSFTTSNNELATEIRNSLEYYSIEFKQSSPSKLILSPTLEKYKQLLLNGLQRVSEDINFLDVNSIFDQTTLSVEQQIRSYIAIGGALRK